MPGTLTVRIFCAEDLPQDDDSFFEGVKKFHNVQKENYCNPYCTVHFAGHKGKTQVIGREQNPEWGKQINLAIMVS